MSLLWLLISIIAFSGCSLLNKDIAFDHRDYVEIPQGTIIKSVPFYVNGSDAPPIYTDYTTGSEGAWFSLDAQKVLKK